jgi:outer membrane biosynthesis protein TonB
MAGLLKVIWMYAIGLALIFYGLYMLTFLQTSSSSGPAGFGVMTTGLLLSMIGGIYGKKKLLESAGEQLPAIEAKQIDQLKQNVVSQLKPPETAADPPKAAFIPKPEIKPPTEVAKPAPIEQPAIAQPAQPAPAAAEGVIKILMCPGCNTENPPSNMFCSKCGKRLRAPEKKATAKKSKKRARKRAR